MILRGCSDNKYIQEEFKMEKIASFQVDHTKFSVGMYISRIDGDIVTYDIRMVKPNGGVYISNPSLHTIEHLFATYARNSSVADKIIYVGPMGCRTGFYLLTRSLPHNEAISLVKDAYSFIAGFDGEIPGYVFRNILQEYKDDVCIADFTSYKKERQEGENS